MFFCHDCVKFAIFCLLHICKTAKEKEIQIEIKKSNQIISNLRKMKLSVGIEWGLPACIDDWQILAWPSTVNQDVQYWLLEMFKKSPYMYM